MSGQSHRVILCEGYLDRSFWKGWLLSLGCRDAREATPRTHRVIDPWGEDVRGGQFAFRSQTGEFIRVVPCQGRSRVVPSARAFIKESWSKALGVLVLNRDLDTDAPDAGDRSSGAGAITILGSIRDADPGSAPHAAGDVVLSAGGRVCLIDWTDPKPEAPGAPSKQVLERLVCACVATVYPGRCHAVEKWLASRPNPPADPDPGEYAWSYMAGWNARLGCEAFFEQVWNDEGVRVELQARLEASGAARIAKLVAA
jgi:hypothetical protein